MKDQDKARPRRNHSAAPGSETAPPAVRTDRKDRKDRTERLAAEVEALSRLNDASSRLWHLTDLKTGLEEILSAALALLGGDKGTVQLLDQDGLLRVVAQHGFDERFLESFRAVAPDDIAATGRALRSRRRIIIEDVESDELYAPLREIAKAAGYRAMQATPILSRGGQPLGMISTHFRSPRRPSEQALRLLDLYVQQAANFIERSQGEHYLRESEQRFKSLSDIVPGTILWASERDGSCSFLSRGWQEHTGQAPEDARQFRWLEMVHPEDRERTRRIFLDATALQEAFVLDFRVRRRHGEYRWMLVAGRPRYHESGEFAGLVGSVIDAHERKLAENALRESEALLAGQKEAFQAAMDGKPLAACLHELVRTAVAHFGGHTRAAFYLLDEATGSTLHHVTGMSDEYAQLIAGFTIGPDSLASGLALHRGTPVITPDVDEDPRWDNWKWLARDHGYRGCWSFPVQTPGGPMLGTFSLYFSEPRSPTPEDLNVVGSLAQAAGIVISRYSEAAERARAEQALTEANRRKDEFLAVLGHELRNPLAPLSTATDLLENARKQPELIDKVRPMMRRQVDHLSRLVDDLLDISRISRGYAELHRAPLDLREAVESAVEQSRPAIAALRHTLSVELGDTPLRVDGDFQRLTQVFCNLLANAAKYSDPGGEIAMRAAPDADAAVVSIKDRGFGIPKDRVAGLFEMFSQVPEHRALVGGGGLGIGLALCRQLVELHGGAIEVRSEGLGSGSEFVVRVPLAAGACDEAEPPAAERSAASRRRRVLVVDDNADAAATLRMVLELQGHEARAAFSGQAALDALAEFDAEVVLLDLGMPGMDGFEVAQRIRALPGGRDVLLVALTGWGQDDDRRRTAEAGFDEHLTKPVDAERLAALLVNDGEAATPPGAASRTPLGSTRSLPG
ncbi:MAG TPA: GAF domain-containing protein [Gammaproteobacteria bacterium]